MVNNFEVSIEFNWGNYFALFWLWKSVSESNIRLQQNGSSSARGGHCDLCGSFHFHEV